MNHEAGYGPFDFEASESIPEGHAEFEDDPPPGDDNEPTLLGVPMSGASQVGQAFFGIEGLEEGARVRATITWDSCPLTAMGTAPTSVATDFDLALYNQTTEEYVYVSQSYDDTAEGFDVRVPTDGNYVLYVIHEEDVRGCDTDGDGEGDSEPWAWAVRWWY